MKINLLIKESLIILISIELEFHLIQRQDIEKIDHLHIWMEIMANNKKIDKVDLITGIQI